MGWLILATLMDLPPEFAPLAIVSVYVGLPGLRMVMGPRPELPTDQTKMSQEHWLWTVAVVAMTGAAEMAAAAKATEVENFMMTD